MHVATNAHTVVRTLIALVATTVAMSVCGAAIAMAMSPVVAPLFGAYVRDPNKEGLNAPSLMAGYVVIALVLAMLHRQVQPLSRVASAQLGLTLGTAVFLGDHLVTAGWSSIPALPMLISGLLDPAQVAVGPVTSRSWASPRTWAYSPCRSVRAAMHRHQTKTSRASWSPR